MVLFQILNVGVVYYVAKLTNNGYSYNGMPAENKTE